MTITVASTEAFLQKLLKREDRQKKALQYTQHAIIGCKAHLEVLRTEERQNNTGESK